MTIRAEHGVPPTKGRPGDALFDWANTLPPVFDASRLAVDAYPRALSRIIQDTVLRQANICLDESHFHSLAEQLEDALAHIPLDSTDAAFWQGVRNTRSYTYRAADAAFSDLQTANGTAITPWKRYQNLMREPAATSSTPHILPLRNAAAAAVVAAMPRALTRASEVVDLQAELMFMLMQQRVSAWVATVREAQPALSVGGGTVPREAGESLARASALIDGIASGNPDTSVLLAIERELAWASYHAGFTDLDHSGLPGEDEITVMIEIEAVRSRFADVLPAYSPEPAIASE